MHIQRRALLALAGAFLLPRIGRADTPSMPPTSAESPDGVRWVTLSSGYKVWTQRIGSGPTKVLLLSGGPGLSHEYMECFAVFLPQQGYELYFYDQLGCGRSDRPSDASLWRLSRSLDEVEEVRAALGLDRMIVVGHSWGGILGLEYALRHPQRIRAFVLSNMTASFADYGAYVQQLREQMPTAVQSRLTALEAAGQTDDAEYQDLVTKYLYARYICRLDPWPEPVLRALEGINPEIYVTMQGANEFLPTGNLKTWDRWADLPRLDVPTLVMGARYDEMNPESIRREAALIPDAALFISETGSHLAMWDDQKAYFDALLSFLERQRG
jgi:proline iminopeptidase